MTSPESNKEREWWNSWIHDEPKSGVGPVYRTATESEIRDILANQHRLSVQACMEVVENKYAKEAELNKHCGDKSFLNLCKDCQRGSVVLYEYSSILSALSEMKEKPMV